MMRLTINGEERSFDRALDLMALVQALGLDARKVAVERNLEIVPRSSYGRVLLSDGDRLEIVQFVGGG
jgi:thiamine biosynthesis protein ThiS